MSWQCFWPRRSKSHSLEDHSDGAKSWVRGMASIGRRLCAQVVKRPGDSAAAHTRDAQEVQGKELKERLTPWSLKVAEYEHQFKTIDEAQKIFLVREVPKDILTGARKRDETVETGDHCERDDG